MAKNGKKCPFLWRKSGRKSTRRRPGFHSDGELVKVYLHGNRSESARASAELMEKHIGMVMSIANRYFRKGEIPRKDLIQSGWLGFFTSLPYFNEDRASLTTYAPFWIMTEIINLIVAESFARSGVRIRHENIRRITHIRRAQAKLFCLGRNANDPHEILTCIRLEEGELAESTSLENIEDCLILMRKAVRLDKSISHNGESAALVNFLPADERGISSEDRIIIKNSSHVLRKHFVQLRPRQIEVLERRFGLNGYEEQTLQEISKVFGISREAVRQTEARAIRNLRISIKREAIAKGVNPFLNEDEEL